MNITTKVPTDSLKDSILGIFLVNLIPPSFGSNKLLLIFKFLI